MKSSFVTTLCVFFILLSCTKPAMPGELPGLREMRWGQTVQSIPYLKPIKESGGFRYYKKLNEQTHIGAASLNEIRYVFYNNRLEGMQFISYGKKDAERLLEALLAANGSPDSNFGEYASWHRDRVHIYYEYNPYSRILNVSYSTDKAFDIRRGLCFW